MNFMEKGVWVLISVLMISGVFAVNDSDVSSGSDDGKFYTTEFYIFLLLFFVALFIIGVAVWFWIRGPKNRWKDKKFVKR